MQKVIKKLEIKDFDEMYDIMQKSFPTEEYRPKDEQFALFSNPRFSVFAFYDEAKLCGFLSAWDFEEFAYFEHFAVLPELRGGGLGKELLAVAVYECSLHGKRAICLEVDLPETQIALRRIAFYERNGFYLNDYEYLQPPISGGRNPVPLKIMTTGGKISEQTFKDIRAVLYKEVYRVGKDFVY